MPLARPTLDEIKERTSRDLASRLKDERGIGLGRLIPRGTAAAIANVIAGESHGQYGRIDYQTLQTWPDTCDAENLDRWGTFLTLPRKAAAAATGGVVFTGTNGTVIPLGTQVQRADGRKFATLSLVTVVGGTALVDVEDLVPGVAGNTAESTPLQLVSSVVGTVTAVTVDSEGLDLGADQETDDDFRRRLIQRFANAPGAGRTADYIRWALEVPGVTRAWALPGNQGPGTVGVTFVVDNDPVSIIPSPTKVAQVQAYIDARRPEPVEVLVFAPALLTIAFTIHLDPDNTTVRVNVTAALQDLFEREGAPGSTIPLSHIDEAISLAAGEIDHVLTVPSAPLAIGAGQIPVVGTITWT